MANGYYGFNRFQPGSVPGATRFYRPDGSNLQLGGATADRVKNSVGVMGALGQRPSFRDGLASLGRAIGGKPDPAQLRATGQGAGQAASQAAAAAGPAIPGGTMAPKPGPAPGATPFGANPQALVNGLGRMGGAPAIPGGTMPPKPGPAPGQAPFNADPQALINSLGALPPDKQQQIRDVLGPLLGQQPPMAPSLGQPPGQPAYAGTPVTPDNYMAHNMNGKNVMVRNGADLQNPRPGDVMTFENGQWTPADERVASELYGQLHIQ